MYYKYVQNNYWKNPEPYSEYVLFNDHLLLFYGITICIMIFFRFANNEEKMQWASEAPRLHPSALWFEKMVH